MLERSALARLAFLSCLVPLFLFNAAPAEQTAAQTAADQIRQNGWKRALEAHVAHVMEDHVGAAILLSVATGELLAAYNTGVAAHHLATPGSAVKPFTLMALLSSGKLDPDARWRCPMHLEIAGRNLDCSHPPPQEAFDARAALAWSCNNWFATMATRLEPRELRAEFAAAGLISATGLIAGETTGNFRDVKTAEDLQLQAIGAASIEITPLELAAAYRRLALRRRDPTSAEKFSAVFQGLEDSVAFGMARPANLGDAPPLAGKTGTAGSGSGWTHAWFAGYWPSARPEVVVVVFLERGRGGRDSAPLARDLIVYYRSSKPTAP